MDLIVDFFAALQDILPAKAVLAQPEDKAPYETDWRRIHNHLIPASALLARVTSSVTRITMA